MFQETKLILQFDHKNSIPMLSFMYYDTKPCERYIRDCMLRLYAASPEDAEKERLATSVAEHHIKRFMEENYERFQNWKNLDESLTRRHPTLKGKQCLCEMIEQELWPQQPCLLNQRAA
ncbi:uncharacterized protein LOC121368377 [Gigantopelta aegis]|uniref:uncharacterized protein LOC121368377 n=1 Tax=Gigantopelta aegis TaxID=1735272 RepID=UPI001B88A57E|nr:uncharacterized protein LOC121368377 [Gigantopelta aegis]